MPEHANEVKINAIVSATAIITLCQIGQFDVLRKLYGQITIPQAVYDEICIDKNSFAAAELENNREWIVVKKISNVTNKALYSSAFHGSEAELLAISRELKKQGDQVLLILDDIAAKRHAKASGFKVTGTLGIIHRAQKEGHLNTAHKDLNPFLENMGQQKIHVDKQAASYFKAKPKKRKKPLSKRDKIIVNALTIAIVLLSVFLVRELYGLGSRQLDLWENDRIQNEIAMLTGGNTDWIAELQRGSTSRMEVASPEDFDEMINRIAAGYTITPEAYNLIFLAPPPEPPNRQPIQQILNIREAFDNEDVIAFINIPGYHSGRPIANGPIAQGPDNDYYLHRTLRGDRNLAGTLFSDFRNSPMFTDHNNIVHGHNMQDRSMFGNIRAYESEAFARNNQYITVVTLYEVTTWRIFASYWIMVEPLEFNYIRPNFSTHEEHQAFLDEIRRRSLEPRPPWWGRGEGGFFFFDYGITPDDIVLTLSTCTNVHDDQRHVVHAVLVERVVPN